MVLDSISGPSLAYGFFDTPFKLLILGDYHTGSDVNSFFSFLEKASQKHALDVYIEDVEFIGLTTDLANTFASQRAAKCTGATCSAWRADEMKVNGIQSMTKNTLRGAIEFLFMCGRDNHICPLKRGNVYRIDLRPQLLVKKANGRVVQMIDDRTFTMSPDTFVRDMGLFVTNRNPQFISVQTKLSFGLIKRVCQIMDGLFQQDPSAYGTLTRWWLEMIRTSYPPWILTSHAFSAEYNGAWNYFANASTKRRDLLHLIATNALMDMTCIATMMRNGCTTSGKFGVVYVGCAHAECIADFFRQFGPCEEAIQNEFKLQPVHKIVQFPSTKLHSSFL
jgi:hypothetical protein